MNPWKCNPVSPSIDPVRSKLLFKFHGWVHSRALNGSGAWALEHGEGLDGSYA